MTLQPYPEYKDPGVPWLGRIPAGWAVLPHRAIFEEIKDRNHPDDEMLSVTIVNGVIRQKALLEGSSKKDSSNQDKSNYKLVCPGDIAYNKMRAWQGAFGASQFRGIISPAYVVQRLRGANNAWYFHHLFRTPYFAKEAERWSYGITSDMWSFRPEHFKVVYSPLPSSDEQSAIVRFISHSDQGLNALIRAKRRLIELLNEQKRAIVNSAVTRGINPNATLKPTGIPWLGDIPKHWELIPLKFVSEIRSGITLGKKYANLNLREYPYLRVANVQAGHLNLKTVKTVRLPDEEVKRSLLQVGDVLMTEGGDPDKLGRGCVWQGEVTPCLHQNHVFAVRANRKRLRPQFLAALLTSNHAQNYFLLTAKQTTNLASTNKSTIGRFRLLLPSTIEQDEILSYIEVETVPVTKAIARAQREIELIREYRTRLVADVVTGQLDVRAAVAQLGPKAETPPPETDPFNPEEEPESETEQA